MISRYNQWKISTGISLFGTFATCISVHLAFIALIVTIFAWQFPKSLPTPAPDYGELTYSTLESYFKRLKFEELQRKHVHTFTVHPDHGWFDTGIVIKRNQKIYVSTNMESDSSNYWTVLTNVWDKDKGVFKTYSNWWNTEEDQSEISTNDILGSKKQDTLKLSAYWADGGSVTVNVIIDYEKYVAELPDFGEGCSN